MTIQSLPDDLTIHLASYFAPADRHQFRRVSKDFRRADLAQSAQEVGYLTSHPHRFSGSIFASLKQLHADQSDRALVSRTDRMVHKTFLRLSLPAQVPVGALMNLIPKESFVHSDRILDIPNDELGSFLTYAAFRGEIDCLNAIIHSDRFRDIPNDQLTRAFDGAAFQGQTECLNAIIHSGRYRDIDLADLMTTFSWLSSRGHGSLDCLNAVIHSERIGEIPNNELGLAFEGAAQDGSLQHLQAFMQSPHFARVPVEHLRQAMILAAKNHEGRINSFIHCGRFQEIDSDTLNEVFRNIAMYIGSSADLHAMIHSERFNEISDIFLNVVFHAATIFGHPECLQAIITSGRFNEIRDELLNGFTRYPACREILASCRRNRCSRSLKQSAIAVAVLGLSVAVSRYLPFWE